MQKRASNNYHDVLLYCIYCGSAALCCTSVLHCLNILYNIVVTFFMSSVGHVIRSLDFLKIESLSLGFFENPILNRTQFEIRLQIRLNLKIRLQI
jgi:hypothetical protein